MLTYWFCHNCFPAQALARTRRGSGSLGSHPAASVSVCLPLNVYSVPVSSRLSTQNRACYERSQPALHPLLNFYTHLACS